MENNFNNKYNKRSSNSSSVLVVTKKKLSFGKKNLSSEIPNKKEEKIVSKEVKLEKSFDTNIKDQDDRIRNLDDDKKTFPSVQSPESKAVKDEEKKVKKKFEKKNKEVRNLDEEFDFSMIEKKKEEVKKDIKKDFLKDLTIISNAKEKSYNSQDEVSAFLNSKVKYEDKKRKNYYDNKAEENERLRSIASMKRSREKARVNKTSLPEDDQEGQGKKEIIIPETITVQELANRMAVRSTDVVKELMKMGMMITATKAIDSDTAELLVDEFGHIAKRVSDSDVEKILENVDRVDVTKMKERYPIVSVMGHVDHGKTSLLDALRESDIASSESGGITQHIGVSKVQVDDKHYITFLDTPGHEAFTAMRLRGAKATDMVILVVAADDGVKEQTIEAINHAKAADIPIIVAVNKIDKEGARAEKVLTELLEHGIVVESMGGDVLYAEVSAKNKLNLDKLIEALLLQAELLSLKANPDCAGHGAIVESKIDKSKGVLATFLLQSGHLKIGDVVVAGTSFGKVRNMISDKGRKLDKIYPSDSAEVLGLDSSPEAGDSFYVVESEKIARDLVEYRDKKRKDLESAKRSKRTLEDIFSDMNKENDLKELSIIVKGDVKGSVEAICTALEKISVENVKIKIIHSAVGGITDSDIILANASDAILLAFNTRLSNQVKESDIKDADIRYYSIIYELIEDIELLVKGMLNPILKDVELGKGVIREVFNLTKYGKVAGSYITQGVAKKSGKCRVIRDSIVIADTELKALKHYKDDVKEVKNGLECGISFENFTNFLAEDKLEFYEIIEQKRD